MNERTYLFGVGGLILVALYFELNDIIFGLCLWLVFEGISNIRLTTLLQKFRKINLEPGLTVFNSRQRFTFDAVLAWRLSVAVCLASSIVLLQISELEILWFFPWFMGFAILGAGASGTCPMLLLLRWLGFK